jgi:hypothetical protein
MIASPSFFDVLAFSALFKPLLHFLFCYVCLSLDVTARVLPSPSDMELYTWIAAAKHVKSTFQ